MSAVEFILLIPYGCGLELSEQLSDVDWKYTFFGIVYPNEKLSLSGSTQITKIINIAYPDLGINVHDKIANFEIVDIYTKIMLKRLENRDTTYTGAGDIPIFCIPFDKSAMMEHYKKSMKKKKFEFIDFNLEIL